MDQTYETRRRSGEHEGSDAKVSKLGQAPETRSRKEKNMSKKKDASTQKPQTPAPLQGVVKEGEYKGHPVLALHRHAEDKSPLMFGTVKAGLILAHFPDIQAFFAKHGEKREAVAAA